MTSKKCDLLAKVDSPWESVFFLRANFVLIKNSYAEIY